MSQVVHATIDPTVTSDPIKQDENENEEETDPDRSITNARIATPTDGLLSSAELHDLFANSGPPLTSAYDIGMKKYVASDEMSKTPIKLFGDRSDIVSGRHGAHEPQWTSYTHYWKTVLGIYSEIVNPNVYSHHVRLHFCHRHAGDPVHGGWCFSSSSNRRSRTRTSSQGE